MISMLFFTGRCISETSLQLKLLLQILYHHFLNHPPFLAYTCNIFLASINFLPPPPIPFSNEPDTTFLHEATIFCNVEHLYIDLAPLCQMNMYCTLHVMMFYQRNIANVWFYSHRIVHTNGTPCTQADTSKLDPHHLSSMSACCTLLLLRYTQSARTLVDPRGKEFSKDLHVMMSQRG